MQAPKKCESRGTLLAVNMVAGEPTEIIILMLIVSASYGESRFFFFLRATPLCCTFRFRCLRSFTIRRVSLCASTMCLYIGSRASVHVFRNADVKATAGQWFVCTSPTVIFFIFFFFALHTRFIHISSTLSSALCKNVVTSSLLQCTGCIGRAFRYWWCFLTLMSMPLLSCCS